MHLLDWYIAKHIWAAVAIVLVVILGLDLMISLGSELDALDAGANFTQVLTYIGLTVPTRVYVFMPLTVLVGCLVGLGTLANNSELTVMRAAGVSIWRIVWSVMQAVALFVLFTAIMGEFVAPESQQMAKTEQAQYKGVASSKGFWLRENDDYIFVRAVSSEGILTGVSRYRFNEHDWQQTMIAERAVYSDNSWSLHKIQVISLEDQQIQQQAQLQAPWPVTLKPHLLSILSMDPKHLAITDLVGYSRYLDQSGLEAGLYELAFWKKILQPLASLALVFVAISFIFGSTRSVTQGQRVLGGVMVGLAFNYTQEILGPASSMFGFTPLLAYLLPIIVCIAVGAVLLRRAG